MVSTIEGATHGAEVYIGTQVYRYNLPGRNGLEAIHHIHSEREVKGPGGIQQLTNNTLVLPTTLTLPELFQLGIASGQANVNFLSLVTGVAGAETADLSALEVEERLRMVQTQFLKAYNAEFTRPGSPMQFPTDESARYCLSFDSTTAGHILNGFAFLKVHAPGSLMRYNNDQSHVNLAQFGPAARYYWENFGLHSQNNVDINFLSQVSGDLPLIQLQRVRALAPGIGMHLIHATEIAGQSIMAPLFGPNFLFFMEARGGDEQDVAAGTDMRNLMRAHQMLIPWYQSQGYAVLTRPDIDGGAIPVGMKNHPYDNIVLVKSSQNVSIDVPLVYEDASLMNLKARVAVEV